MKVLIVDDEELIRNVIKEYLVLNDYEYGEAENGKQAVEKIKNENYDIVIMDIMMPEMDGFKAVKKIREFNKEIPFIMLTARSEEYDKLMGFDLGIDDYVTKPFSPKELLARIKAIVKRTNNKEENYNFDGLKIDKIAHEVYIDSNVINLTPKEYELLLYLVENKNIVLTREQLLSSIWGYDFYGDDRTIDTHVKTLRSRLGKYRDFIKTVRKVGYKFEYKK